jgi:hypothetical protein
MGDMETRERRGGAAMFWVWLSIALLGEMGIAVFVLGALTEAGALWLGAELALAPERSVASSSLWWLAGSSAVMLLVGLGGLRREQRADRGMNREPPRFSMP